MFQTRVLSVIELNRVSYSNFKSIFKKFVFSINTFVLVFLYLTFCCILQFIFVVMMLETCIPKNRSKNID